MNAPKAYARVFYDDGIPGEPKLGFSEVLASYSSQFDWTKLVIAQGFIELDAYEPGKAMHGSYKLIVPLHRIYAWSFSQAELAPP